MASTLSWCPASMISTRLPTSALHSAVDLLGRRLGVSGRRRQDAPAVLEELGEAGLGAPSARCRRWDGRARNGRPAAWKAADSRGSSHCFHRADVGDDGAGRPGSSPSPAASALVGADRRRQHHQVGTGHRQRRSPPRSAPPGQADFQHLGAGCRAARGSRLMDSRRHRPRLASARASEEPMRPTPMMATRWNCTLTT
jgi:hypothetical protein